jgi:single-stranded DNA-binding protein
MESWVGKEDGQKRSKLVVVLDDVQFLEPKQAGMNEGGSASRPATTRRTASPGSAEDGYGESEASVPQPADQEIPF